VIGLANPVDKNLCMSNVYFRSPVHEELEAILAKGLLDYPHDMLIRLRVRIVEQHDH